MSWDQETRAVGILNVAELALTQFEAASDPPPVASELRAAIDRAKSDPEDDKVEDVRAILMSEPELEALLREKFPEGVRPRPFRNRYRRLYRR
jgi:hypothetical protein